MQFDSLNSIPKQNTNNIDIVKNPAFGYMDRDEPIVQLSWLARNDPAIKQ